VPLSSTADGPIAVLDDDPTGVQTLGGVRVLLAWRRGRVSEALAQARSVHLLTNSRAFVAEDARAIVASAASAVVSSSSEATPILRGDSTLRGHVLEEYLGLRDAWGSVDFPPLLLVPALPTAGRVTIGGIQYLEQEGSRVPVHMTEFAADGPFAYSSSRLLEWAEQRTKGLFEAEKGIEIGIETLRLTGPDALVDAVGRAKTAGTPTALSVDAETGEDVEVVAEGVRRARVSCGDFIVRCGPALAGALGRATAVSHVDLPSAPRVLVVCGSYVAQSARQLVRLSARFPEEVVEVDPFSLSTGESHSFASVTGRLRERLDVAGLAVLAVSGPRPERLADLANGMRVARGLATLVASIDSPDALVVLKGGVTSAVVLKDGLGALEAEILGPVLPGVALWQVLEPEARQALVVPGNVGDDDLLVRIVDLVRTERA
jgi:uncharacterized protein YgbK (DUF1537 family)